MSCVIHGASQVHLLKNHEKIHITTHEGMRLACQTHPASCVMPHIHLNPPALEAEGLDKPSMLNLSCLAGNPKMHKSTINMY